MFSGLKNGSGCISHGEYSAVTADDTANSTAINTGLTSIDSVLVQVRRGGKVATSDAAVSYSGGVLTVGDGSTYVLTAGDVISYLAIGK